MNTQPNNDGRISAKFYGALKEWDGKQARSKFAFFSRQGDLRKALFAAWWFIENVRENDLDRNDLFLKVRGLVRKAQMLD